MKTLTEIQSILHNNRDELRTRYGIMNLAVFGSVVRGEAKETSDVDVLVDFLKPVDLLELISAENYLSDLLNLKVDLVPRKSVRHELRDRILSEAVLI